MITAAQLRAARGLLDWTRSELAKASGLSAETIKNIEHGVYAPQDSTIAAIVRTFAEKDVEFTENDGIRKSSNIVINYEGAADFKKYVDDMYKLLSEDSHNREIYVFGNNDEGFLAALGDYADFHFQRMSKLTELKFKALILEGTDALASKFIEYRHLPNFSFAVPFSTYGNYLDFILFGTGTSYPKVVSIKSEAIASAYKSQFDALWKMSLPISDFRIVGE